MKEVSFLHFLLAFLWLISQFCYANQHSTLQVVRKIILLENVNSKKQKLLMGIEVLLQPERLLLCQKTKREMLASVEQPVTQRSGWRPRLKFLRWLIQSMDFHALAPWFVQVLISWSRVHATKLLALLVILSLLFLIWKVLWFLSWCKPGKLCRMGEPFLVQLEYIVLISVS